MQPQGLLTKVAIEVCNSPPPHPRGLGQPKPRGPFEDCPRARTLVISVQEITNISARNLTEILGMDFRFGFCSTIQVENPYLRFPSSFWAGILGMDFRLGFYSHNPSRKSIPKISVIFRAGGITTFHVWECPSPPSPICPPSPSPESTAPLHSSPVSSHSSGPGPPPQQPLTPASEFACFSARKIRPLLIVRGRHYLARFFAGFQSHIKHFMIYVVLYIASCLFPKTSLYCQPYHCVATCGCMYCIFISLVIYIYTYIFVNINVCNCSK